MTKILVLALGASLCSFSALAQSSIGPATGPGPGTAPVAQGQPNTTGNDPSVSVSRGATGAETATTDSAAGGNASKPEQAVPNSSAGGGGR
ncbi:hypothetical protein FV218_12490 [Methylobacterium sp. WL69]|jgi:hypothetical protein|nr:hypothetical protein FV218_12490 [Methylobacterium sp. WL69]